MALILSNNSTGAHVTGPLRLRSLIAQFARNRTLAPHKSKHSQPKPSQAPDMASNYYYPIDVPPLELPASQTRFPTLQPAGAFLKQMQSPYSSNAYALQQQLQHQQQLKSAHVGAAASPTSPSSVAVASSFLASIRMGLEDLVHDDDDDDDSDEDDDDDDESPRYYSASSNNTYYSPPSSFSAQAYTTSSSSSSLFPTTQASAFPLQQGAAASRNTQKSDDDLIFDMEM